MKFFRKMVMFRNQFKNMFHVQIYNIKSCQEETSEQGNARRTRRTRILKRCMFYAFNVRLTPCDFCQDDTYLTL